MPETAASPIALSGLEVCFEGAAPAVIATASADDEPNVTYLSRVRLVDDSHIALSNQFFSKTTRNLAENPQASVLLIDPTTFDQYRLAVVYERTERRGPLFDRLGADVDAVAALSGMTDVFRLRAADIYRVVAIDRVVPSGREQEAPAAARALGSLAASTAELSRRLARAADLDGLVDATVRGLADLVGCRHSLLLLLDESGERLYTLGSHGYEAQGIGSEVVVGEGQIGLAASRGTPIRVGHLGQMARYSGLVRRSFEDAGDVAPGREIEVPVLADAQSRLALPLQSSGELIGVLVLESPEPVAFSEEDEVHLTALAGQVAAAIDAARMRAALATGSGVADGAQRTTAADAEAIRVRFYDTDGSTFLDDDYLIKGVAGRILWSLLGQYERDGRVDFTNREVRLDPTLELPEFRDNLESRLILLKRRLDEREAPIRIEKTGRGRFRLDVDGPLVLEKGGQGSTPTTSGT